MKFGSALVVLTACAFLTAADESPAALPTSPAAKSPMPSLAPMVKRASPSVVNIATRGTVKEQAEQHNPLMDDPFFRRFFNAPPDAKPRERQFRSAGSGVIVDAEFIDAADGGGVLVRTVQDGSPAAQTGLKANDLIVGVGRTPVSNTKTFREAAKGANVLVLNVRRGSPAFLIPLR